MQSNPQIKERNIAALQKVGFSTKQIGLFDKAGYAARDGDFVLAVNSYKNLFHQVQKSLKLRSSDMPEYIASMYAAACVQCLIHTDTLPFIKNHNSGAAIDHIKTLISISMTSFQHRLRNFNTMGFLHLWMQDFHKAEKYFKQENQTAKQLSNEKAIRLSTMNIAVAKGCQSDGHGIHDYLDERATLAKPASYVTIKDIQERGVVLTGGKQLGDSVLDLMNLWTPWFQSLKTIYLDLDNVYLQTALLERASMSGIEFVQYLESECPHKNIVPLDMSYLWALSETQRDTACFEDSEDMEALYEELSKPWFKSDVVEDEKRVFLCVSGDESNPGKHLRDVRLDDVAYLKSACEILSNTGHTFVTNSKELFKKLTDSEGGLTNVMLFEPDMKDHKSLLQLIDVLSGCKVVVTVDTGVAHLASVLQKQVAVVVHKNYYYPGLWNTDGGFVTGRYDSPIYPNTIIHRRWSAQPLNCDFFADAMWERLIALSEDSKTRIAPAANGEKVPESPYMMISTILEKERDFGTMLFGARVKPPKPTKAEEVSMMAELLTTHAAGTTGIIATAIDGIITEAESDCDPSEPVETRVNSDK